MGYTCGNYGSCMQRIFKSWFIFATRTQWVSTNGMLWSHFALLKSWGSQTLVECSQMSVQSLMIYLHWHILNFSIAPTFIMTVQFHIQATFVMTYLHTGNLPRWNSIVVHMLSSFYESFLHVSSYCLAIEPKFIIYMTLSSRSSSRKATKSGKEA